MVRFECDTCATLKEPGEEWILGRAAENIGVTAARREIAFSSAWNEKFAVEPFAVHFCSEECRAEYMRRLFGDVAPATATQRKVTRKKIARVLPEAVVETVIEEKKPVVRKRTRTRRSA
jgi:hypothetical protein